MVQISILGCGWLGLPLGENLMQSGFIVKGSTTTSDKKEILETSGIPHYSIALDPEIIPDELPKFLEGSSILIIAIPPKLRGKNKDYSDANKNSFVKKIASILPTVEKSTVDKIIFISSTAVYGEANTTVTEASKPIPVTESGKQLLEIEELLLNNKDLKTTIIRFGGLIGPDRNPARFLAGKENVSNPDGPVNLIHLEDCIGVIKMIINDNIWNERLNAVAPNHPTRKTYYTEKALEQNLIPPTFDETTESVGKTIASDKLIQQYNYTFTQLTL
ncbi:Rossmann-fold NAD(P)-binding domain-containing protein [Flavobacterium algicola]|uniref:SDR family NAD(P)-dependent oxidoreductase n=1 Tax=Flavobacterium algicola TaxID=556529 RepID=UPI001EFE64FF|nr:SDR family NAD(P)-dependent oxidoreductase [Flavobacterium algicola]MCG9791816.1 SDR family NAD(P)-dependent oxidoreductase [Flavobacterium algicola]